MAPFWQGEKCLVGISGGGWHGAGYADAPTSPGSLGSGCIAAGLRGKDSTRKAEGVGATAGRGFFSSLSKLAQRFGSAVPAARLRLPWRARQPKRPHGAFAPPTAETEFRRCPIRSQSAALTLGTRVKLRAPAQGRPHRVVTEGGEPSGFALRPPGRALRRSGFALFLTDGSP